MNKVILKGRLTKDPEVRYTSESNIPVARFTLAVDRRFVKQGEERQADFVNCVAWNKTAEFTNKYFTKGKEALIEGRITTRSWDDTEGKKQYTTEVTVEGIEFCGTKNNSNGSGKIMTEAEAEEFFPIESDDELPFK